MSGGRALRAAAFLEETFIDCRMCARGLHCRELSSHDDAHKPRQHVVRPLRCHRGGGGA